MRRIGLWVLLVALAMWAVILSLVFTGHSRIFWATNHAVKAVNRAGVHGRHALHRLEGDKDLTQQH
ncbi:hypothetical protein [Sphingomonas nostoxanthinifaciens]|uniref:hypothetical protein n=1 Tax=Sphingomonas nostoxanthinifaciens TaxID=2872652 RepID=UPI001CC21DBB|nr:hypothetical protein [Sphingomonas nostoxanthinifaciens]UAK23398.1 hypothetical protein K8P63_13465 [Sphingomonas nostoxanthinifaciens]